MNSDGLARFYDRLGPWERLPLLVAAAARGDTVECERLARSAPTRAVVVADFWGLAQGLADAARHYLLQQLEWATLYWQASALLEGEPLVNDAASAERLKEVSRALAER